MDWVGLDLGEREPFVRLHQVLPGLGQYGNSCSIFACYAAKSLQSCQFFATPWTVARQAPLSMGFSRQEYWIAGLPFPSPGHLPNPGIEPRSPALQADSLPTEEKKGIDELI